MRPSLRASLRPWQPPVRPLATATAQALAAMVARRRQLIDMLGAERNRQAQARDRQLQRQIGRTSSG
jgi:transposase